MYILKQNFQVGVQEKNKRVTNHRNCNIESPLHSSTICLTRFICTITQSKFTKPFIHFLKNLFAWKSTQVTKLTWAFVLQLKLQLQLQTVDSKLKFLHALWSWWASDFRYFDREQWMHCHQITFHLQPTSWMQLFSLHKDKVNNVKLPVRLKIMKNCRTAPSTPKSPMHSSCLAPKLKLLTIYTGEVLLVYDFLILWTMNSSLSSLPYRPWSLQIIRSTCCLSVSTSFSTGLGSSSSSRYRYSH